MSPLASLIAAGALLAAGEGLAEPLPSIPVCSPIHCDVSAASTPERLARLQTALGRLHAIDPSLADEALKVKVVLFPQSDVLLGFFDALNGIVAAREDGEECELVSTLGHELTHARRLGVGPDSAMVKFRQPTAEEFAAFMLEEEGRAHIAQVKIARAMKCADELPAADRGFAARIEGKTDAEAMEIFLGLTEFTDTYRAAYTAQFERANEATGR